MKLSGHFRCDCFQLGGAGTLRWKTLCGIGWLLALAVFTRLDAAGASVLETIADVRAVAEWQPTEPRPLALRGVVTLVDKQRGLLVLQDGWDVLALEMGELATSASPGQRVLVTTADSWPTHNEAPRFPHRPDRSEWLKSFEQPAAQQGFYIARFRGWIHPPVTGEYHFCIASDDSSQLLLGTDASPESREIIARVQSYSEVRDWLRAPWQRSAGLRLEAGRAYYIEAVHHQAGGQHHLSVAWEGPDIPLQLVPGRFLSPWSADPSARRERGLTTSTEPGRGSILREVWEDVTVDNPIVLVAPRKLASSLSVRDPKLQVLGPGPWPEPTTAPIGQTVSPSDNFRWARVFGTVTHLTPLGDRLVLEIADGGKRVEVVVTDPAQRAESELRGRRIEVHGAGEALWDAGQMILGRVWAPSLNELTLLKNPPNPEFSRATTIHELSQDPAELPQGTAVRLVGRVVEQRGTRVTLRDSGTFQAYTSRDGQNWIHLGSKIEVELPDTALVGLAVNSRSQDKFSDAVFTDVSGLPQPLQIVDVGEPRRAGEVNIREGRYEIKGVGSDIWNTPDQFTFVHAPMAGDGAVVARVASLSLADSSARAGIMFRESLNPYAQLVQLVHSAYSGQLVASAQWRVFAVGKTQHSVDAPPAGGPPPEWLKLERRTSRITIQAHAEVALQAGDPVEVAGYIASEAGAPVIVDAAIRPIHAKHQESPLAGGWRPYAEIVSLLNDSLKWGGFDFFRMRGVVTFSGEVMGRRYWTLQDATGAVSLAARDSSKLFHVPAGTLVDVFSNPGWFPRTNTLFADNVFRIGEAALPKPIKHPAQYLLPKRGEGTWIEIEGVGRAATGDGLLAVKTKGELFTVAVLGASKASLEGLVDASLRIRGAIVFPSEQERMLLVPSAQQVELLRPPPADPFACAAESTRDLAANALLNESRHRTRVAGFVTLASPAIVFVQDEFGGAQVELAAGASVAPGAAVDVAGFPEAGHMGGIVLRHALVRTSGKPAAVAPSAMVLTEDTDGREHTFQLRRIRATVTGVEGDWLELDANGRLLRAARPVSGEALPKLPAGSVVDVMGVFVPTASSFPWVRAAERASVQPAPQLLLRSAADVDVLSTPKWWAVRRTLLGAGLFTLIVGGGFVWIQILRRRVRQRSAELAETMKKLEEEVRMSATLAERDRLAGEIHDSVEQGLNGLVMQLDTAADLKDCPAEVRAELRLARNMAAFSRTEVKHAIWELQSPLLDDSDLPQAVQKVVTQLVPESLNAQVNVVGEIRRLPSAVEHHLLRLVQEAVNNVVKHARAQNLEVELRFESDALAVMVRDDGCGFDPKNRHVERLGHFGLSSIRNRANKLLAELDIVSSPGQGTRVCVRVPCPPS